MKELQKEFVAMGDKFIQEAKSGNVYMYRRGDNQWEVVIAQVAKNDYTFPGGATVKAGDVSYPSTSSWGRIGWTFNDRVLAVNKFDSLCKSK